MPKPTDDEHFLALIRETLAAVARDTAPTAGQAHRLKDGTIQMMRECFAAVSKCEHELRGADNKPEYRPRYADERPLAPLVRWPTGKKKEP